MLASVSKLPVGVIGFLCLLAGKLQHVSPLCYYYDSLR